MASCNCCLTIGSQIIVGGADISEYAITVNVDSTRDILWEPGVQGECEADYDNKVYLYGPGKSTLQVTAYPFSNTYAEFNLGFTCPMDVSVQVPWKYIFDCRQCSDCLDPETGLPAGKIRGRWVGIPMKKKNVTVTGDIENPLFVFKGCASPATKFTLQAGPNVAIVPQPTRQYSGVEYKGLPIQFDTDAATKAWDLTVKTNESCRFAAGFTNVKAYLTGFTFSYQPPSPPTVTYNFDAMVSYCPEC
jgi:hypothetical protein